jgi:hypothetical protein
MESFEVDIDPAQVVRWIMAERKTSPSTFKTIATRAGEVRAIPNRSEYHLAQVENVSARQHITRLLESIEQDRHTVDQAPASRR